MGNGDLHGKRTARSSCDKERLKPLRTPGIGMKPLVRGRVTLEICFSFSTMYGVRMCSHFSRYL